MKLTNFEFILIMGALLLSGFGSGFIISILITPEPFINDLNTTTVKFNSSDCPVVEALECPKLKPISCPEVKSVICPPCNDLSLQKAILKAEKDLDWASYYQEEANKSLAELDDLLFYNKYLNCSELIPDIITNLETAGAFYKLASKKFSNISNNILAAAYYNSSISYYEFNKDYVEYLKVQQSYCKLKSDNKDYSNNDYMSRNGDKWLNRSNIHFQEYEHNMRLIYELKREV